MFSGGICTRRLVPSVVKLRAIEIVNDGTLWKTITTSKSPSEGVSANQADVGKVSGDWISHLLKGLVQSEADLCDLFCTCSSPLVMCSYRRMLLLC